MFRQPALGLAEIAWRWSFGAAATFLAFYCLFGFLDTLPVGRTDLLLLNTRQPALVAQAIARIFRGSAPRFVWAWVVLFVAMTLAWIIVAAFGRSVSLRALITYLKELRPDLIDASKYSSGLRALIGLNLLRAATFLAATIGVIGAFVFGGAVSTKNDPSPGSAFLVFLTILMFVGMAWGAVNWFLSLAGIFAVRQGQNTFGSICDAADLCRNRLGAVLAVGSWFGLAHGTALFVASSVVAFPLGFATILPAGVVLGGVLFFSLLYFFVADFLYAGRLTAYLCIAEGLDIVPVEQSSSLDALPPASTRERVDPDDLILSDVPFASEPC